jgi:putative drug exporter of the RND superfamily
MDNFARWSLLMARRRWTVVVLWAIVLALGAVLLQPRANAVVKGGTSATPGSDSARAASLLTQAFHFSNDNTLIVVLHSTAHRAGGPWFDRTVRAADRSLQTLPQVGTISSYLTAPHAGLTSKDAHTTLVEVSIRGSAEDASSVVEAVRSRLRGIPGSPMVTGYPALIHDTLATSEKDLKRSELFTIPIVLILLLLVFRTVVAATIPLVLGACSVVLTLSLIGVIGSFVETSVFALNIASMIGLGLGIDFSLIVVARYREELRSGRDVDDAVARTMATAGRSITYSGITVILAMAIMTLVMHDLVIIRSISMAVILVAIVSLCAALTLLPAVLALLGSRIEILSVVPRRTAGDGTSQVWYRVSHSIMQRPWVWLLAGLVLLALAASPVRSIKLDIASPEDLPPSTESAAAAQLIAHSFGAGALNPIQIVISAPTRQFWTQPTLAGIGTLSNLVSADPRIASTESLPALTAAAGIPTAAFDHLTPTQLTASPALSRAAASVVSVRGGTTTTVIDVVSRYSEFDGRHEALVQDLRSKIVPAVSELSGTTVVVGGASADFLDYQHAIYSRFPIVVIGVGLLIFLILMTFFQSIVLPIKAILLNLVSIVATYGLLVLVFQNGVGTSILGFTPIGRIDATTPAVLYVILLALSTDYEVFMLSRVREQYAATHDNRESVAVGLTQTAGVVTAAGLILVGTFGSFVSADVLIMKEVGLGLALGILIDTTVVRVVLVPATMQLMGDLNWWMPAWLSRFVPELREGELPDRDRDRLPVTPAPASVD